MEAHKKQKNNNLQNGMRGYPKIQNIRSWSRNYNNTKLSTNIWKKKKCPFVVLLDTAKFCLQKRPFVRYDIKVNFYYWDHDIFFMLSIPLNIAKLLKITKKYKLTFYISWLWPRPRVSMASLVFFFIPTWFIWYLTYNSRLILSCLIFHMPGIVFAHKLRPFWGHRDGRSLGAEKNFQYFGETI